MSYYRDQLNDWINGLAIKAKTVFDVGGKQNPIENRPAIWKVKNYKILDLPDFDIEDENTWIQTVEEADVIFCLEVFEYLINPVVAIQNLAEMLKTGGKLYATFQFVYPHHNELEFDSLRYTENGVERLAKEAGLKIKNKWYRVDKSGLLKQFYAADGMRAAKEYNHHDATGFIVEFTK